MRRHLASSRLLLLSATLALGIGLLVANQLFVSRTATWQRAQEASSNLLFTVSYVLERTLRSADLSIRHAIRLLNQADGQMTDAGVSGAVLGAAVSQDGVGLLLVLDHTGKVVGSSQPMGSKLMAFADRDYFKVHQHNADVGLFISPPFASRRDGEPSIALSRRWSHADGSFGGIVVQTIKLDILQDLFAPIELGPDSGINLFLTDGTIVMRFPYTGEMTGASLAGTPISSVSSVKSKVRSRVLRRWTTLSGSIRSECCRAIPCWSTQPNPPKAFWVRGVAMPFGLRQRPWCS